MYSFNLGVTGLAAACKANRLLIVRATFPGHYIKLIYTIIHVRANLLYIEPVRLHSAAPWSHEFPQRSFTLSVCDSIDYSRRSDS